MTKEIKALFIDIDGTLYSHHTHSVPESAKRALSALRKKGIPVLVTSGRHIAEIAQMPAVDEMEFDGYVLINGQCCYNGQKKAVYGQAFDQAHREVLLRIFNEKKYPLELAEDDRLLINYIDEEVELAHSMISTPPPVIDKASDKAIYMACGFPGSKRLEAFEKELGEGFVLTRWRNDALDIIADADGKMSGIRWFTEQLGIEEENVMAIGDGFNDVQMIRYAGVGVAMGNSDEETLKYADYVTADIDEDGLALALEHYGLIDREDWA